MDHTNQRRSRQGDELFMDQQQSQQPTKNDPETPTVGPLRINKTPTSSPPDQPAAPNGYSRPPYPDYYGQPTSPPPNRPLPYPDDRRKHQQTPSSQQQLSSSYSVQSHQYAAPSHTQHSESPRPHFAANDPRRPTVAGYGPGHDSPGSLPKPLPESPGPDAPDKDGFMTGQQGQYQYPEPPQSSQNQQAYYPPPGSSSAAELRIPNPSSVNRLASTSSVSTTKAARGSPPPPETPAVDYPPGGGIEARYAAAGIAGPSTLSSLQASSIAAQQRRNEYAQQQPPEPQARRNPSEQSSGVAAAGAPGQQSNGVQRGGTSQQPHVTPSRPAEETVLEQDMQRMQVSDEPPPAYSSVSPPAQGFPADKRPPHARPNLSVSADLANAGQGQPAASANEPDARAGQQRPTVHSPQPSHTHAAVNAQRPENTPSPAPNRTSPPPLPEGWIAHLDQNSGHYYYIHLPTQSTQWEFPKGPTPLNLDPTPLSPTGTITTNPFTSPTASTFVAKPLASPGMIPQRESMMTMASITSPTAAGFTVAPPASGVDVYRIAPTNGVYFGPYLRYTNMDVENGVWYGSILLVVDGPHPPTIHIHQSQDLSPNPRQLKSNHIYQHQRWQFFRYDIDLRMEDDRESKWTYAVTSHLGCTRYEFLVAGKHETSWRFIAHSGNDFELNVNANERNRVGGVGYMWKDIMQKHMEVGGFHAQLGLGNQINADRMWKEIGSLRQWTAMSGKENRKNAPWTAQHEEEVTHAYFHYYSSHFDQPHLREAFAQIPHVLTLDDHDIFDGFGSYPEHMQFSHMFRNIGRIGIEMYLLFQHHTTLNILKHVTNDLDLFTITGTGWHFVKYLGPSVVVVGPDCRSERNPYQVMAGPTYQGLFPKVALLPPCVQHCIWMIPVPVVYPRLDSAEQFAQTMATGKKAVTGTFNALGKVTGSVAGIVGAKGFVNEGFASVKKAVGKSGLMSNVLSPFGEIDILDELRDQWTHESKDIERTYLIRTLQSISHNKSLRMSFFSGSSNCCGAGLLSDPSVSPPSSSHKAMFQIISSAVVNAPPSPYVLRMLHPHHLSSHGQGPHNAPAGSTGPRTNDRPLYVPQNGQRSRPDGPPTDTKEDMLEVFAQDVTGQQRDMKRLMGRRNYCAVVSFDPEAVSEAFGHGSVAGSVYEGKGGGHSVSLAVDWFVQTDQGQFAQAASAQAATVKYGPLTIPSVPPGH